MSLIGKVAIVTGSGRGIGRGVAIELAKEGVNVVVASRTAESVHGVVDLIISSGGKAIGIVCDVNSPGDIRAMVATTLEAWDVVDILVNNAQGSFGTAAAEPTPIEDASAEMLTANFLGGPIATLRAMQAVFPVMKQHGGSIINFGSLNGQVGRAATSPYNAAKEAVRSLSRTAAREWAQYGITVNVINPTILSDSTANLVRERPEFGEWLEKGTPLGRVGEPWEVGRVVAFLASEEACFITGMTFMVDGGRIMGADTRELRYPNHGSTP